MTGPEFPGLKGLLLWWFVLGVLTLAFAVVADFGKSREWMAHQTGEEGWLPQVKGVTDLARQLTRPLPDTADDLSTSRSVGSLYGVNTFLHHEVGQSRRAAVIRLASEAGFSYLRQPLPWQDVEMHASGDFNDRRNDPARSAWYKYDNIVDLALAEGMHLIFRLDDPPGWAIENQEERGSQAPPQDFQDYGKFVKAVATHFRGRVRHYQIWNEPNIYPEWGNQPVSPEEYAELLRIAATSIRRADPDAVIVLAAMASTTSYDGDSRARGSLNDLIYLNRLYLAGAAPYFDVLAMQGYGLWSGPFDRRMHPLVINFGRVQFARDLMVQHNDAGKPIWISEMNWNAVPVGRHAPFGRVSLETQARYLPQAFERVKEWPWVELVNVWYLKRAQPVWEEAEDPQAHFRLMTHDGILMPAYRSLQTYLLAEKNATTSSGG